MIVPHFSYDAELKRKKAHEALRENGTLLIPDPKLKSDLLEGLIQEVVKHDVSMFDGKGLKHWVRGMEDQPQVQVVQLLHTAPGKWDVLKYV